MKCHKKSPQLNFNHYESIIQKVKHVDELNKQLLSISSQLQNSSFLHQNKSGYKSMVGEFEKQMRQTVQAIIDNIKQFFIDIDKKLKNVALAVCEEGNNKEKQDFKYSMLYDKVKNLQHSLKKTQQHETKLLEIIQTMMHKYQITDEPTLLRNQPIMMRDRQRTTSTQNLIHGSQKLRSPFFEESVKMERSLHENLYMMDESIVSSSLKSLRINDSDKEPEQQVFIKKLYSKSTIPSQEKRSLKVQKGMCGSTNKISFMKAGKDQSQVFEDKRHRMNYMMDKLQK